MSANENLSRQTMLQVLRHRAQTEPRRTAMRQKRYGIWTPITWHEYYERAKRVGLGLAALGVGRGTHVGVLSENRVEWVLSELGAGLVGAVTVGVYPTSPANEVAYVLGHADVRVVICEDQEQADKVLDSRQDLPALEHVIVLETKGLAETQARAPGIVQSFAELEALGAKRNDDAAQIDALLAAQTMDDIAIIIYTSGSTGKPKGAMLSYRNIAAAAPGVIERLELSRETAHLSYLPLCHVAEQLLTCFVPIYLGSRVDFGESIRTVQEDLREVAPTMFLGVPRIWEKMHSSISIKMQETGRWRRALYQRALRACEPFAHKAATQRSLVESAIFAACYWTVFRALQNFIGLREARVAMTGAAPVSPAILSYFRTIGLPLIEIYGMTETSGVVLAQRKDAVRFGTVGSPTRGVQHRVSPQGELLVKGDAVFCGYYKNPEATAGAIVDGWLHTGDVVQEVDGQVRIVDRLKDVMITAGGKNLTPSEIENTMKASPFIKECIIIADTRKFVGALIQIEYDIVARWAEQRGCAFTHYRSLVELPEVRELIQSEVNTGNARLAEVAQIRRFHLLTKELDHDDGEVTPTMKVRRASINKLYAGEIEALFR